ncbi:MAG: hypothetical protein GXO25_06650, partial [Euryarchaeota archaeon]|nr:hypothetical protein [Euryarchaeota archaeon]
MHALYLMQHKWKILIVAMFVNLSIWAGDVIPVSQAGRISASLAISPGYYAFLISLPILMMVLFSIPAGFLVVRLGAKRTATYGMLIAFAGAALRGFAWNSLSFTLFTAI